MSWKKVRRNYRECSAETGNERKHTGEPGASAAGPRTTAVSQAPSPCLSGFLKEPLGQAHSSTALGPAGQRRSVLRIHPPGGPREKSARGFSQVPGATQPGSTASLRPADPAPTGLLPLRPHPPSQNPGVTASTRQPRAIPISRLLVWCEALSQELTGSGVRTLTAGEPGSCLPDLMPYFRLEGVHRVQ